MIPAPLVIAGGVPCSKCSGVISEGVIAEGNFFGSAAGGFICIECMENQIHAIQLFGQELTTHYKTTDYPCAKCGQPFDEGYLVEIDNKIGELCTPCAEWYFLHGGISKGTEAEWILKLK